MAQNRYGLYPATLTYGGGTPTTLDVQQLGRVGIRANAKRDVIVPSGNVDPSAVIFASGEPEVDWETDDLATVLAVVTPTAGLNCTGGAVFQAQQRADGGTFAGGSTNVAITSKKGFCYPKRLSAKANEPGGAKLQLAYAALYDGTTSGVPALPVAPLVLAAGQALVSTPAFNARFYFGPVYLNAAAVGGVEDWDLDFGIEFKTKLLDGDLWPQVGSIISRKPKLSLTAVDGVTANAIAASLFNAPLAGALALYLRKGAAGGARVADATVGHLKLTIATGAANLESLDIQGQEDGTFKVSVEATGTIAVSTASAIP